jgi:hypothetical protein
MIWYCSKMSTILVVSMCCRCFSSNTSDMHGMNIKQLRSVDIFQRIEKKMGHPWRGLLFGYRPNPDIRSNFVGSRCWINLEFQFLSQCVVLADHMNAR